MNNELIARYQRGGDIYIELQAKYGTAAADSVAQAAVSADRTKVTAAITAVKYGPALNDSTASIFLDQILTDPFAAPLDSLNNQLGKLSWNILKNPFVLALVVGGGLLLAYKYGFFGRKGSR